MLYRQITQNLWKKYKLFISDTRDKQLSITYLQHELTWERNLWKLIRKGNKSENLIYVWRLMNTYLSRFNSILGSNFIFLCFKTHYHTLQTTKTNENKIWTRDKIEPQHIHLCPLSSLRLKNVLFTRKQKIK